MNSRCSGLFPYDFLIDNLACPAGSVQYVAPVKLDRHPTMRTPYHRIKPINALSSIPSCGNFWTHTIQLSSTMSTSQTWNSPTMHPAAYLTHDVFTRPIFFFRFRETDENQFRLESNPAENKTKTNKFAIRSPSILDLCVP